MGGALVLDAETKSALAAIRSLGREGVPVCAGGVRSSAMGLHSRYVRETFVYPDPKVNRSAFVVAVKAAARRLRGKTGEVPVAFCFSDATHLTLTELFDPTEELIIFPLPPKESVAVAFDKTKTAELAKRQGIRTIEARPVGDAHILSYPAIVKPPQSVVWRGERAAFGTAQFVMEADELTAAYDKLKQQTGMEPIIQTALVGEEYGVELMCDHGNVLAEFAHVRLRSLSPTGGAAVVKETAPPLDMVDTMKAQSKNLARALNWTGPMMVEWKVDARTDIPHLMEINARFWGSLPLPVAAGVDFPWLYYKLMRGERQVMSETFVPTAVRTRHFWGDVKWLMKVLFDRTRVRYTHYPKRWWALRMFLMEPLRSQGDVWNRRDPLPAFFEFIDILRR